MKGREGALNSERMKYQKKEKKDKTAPRRSLAPSAAPALDQIEILYT